MSGSTLRLIAELPLIDVTPPTSSTLQYLGGIATVDYYGPVGLIVSEESRQGEIAALARAIRQAWDAQSAINTETVKALRDAADRIERGSAAAEVLVPLLLTTVTKAVQ